MQEASGIIARILLEWTPDASGVGFSIFMCCYGNLRVGLILSRSVWMVWMKSGLSKVIFGRDYFFSIFGPF